MGQVVDFQNVSTAGLECSPVVDALAGLRANEARYFKNKYGHDFTVEPAADAADTLAWVERILASGPSGSSCPTGWRRPRSSARSSSRGRSRSSPGRSAAPTS